MLTISYIMMDNGQHEEVWQQPSGKLLEVSIYIYNYYVNVIYIQKLRQRKGLKYRNGTTQSLGNEWASFIVVYIYI